MNIRLKMKIIECIKKVPLLWKSCPPHGKYTIKCIIKLASLNLTIVIYNNNLYGGDFMRRTGSLAARHGTLRHFKTNPVISSKLSWKYFAITWGELSRLAVLAPSHVTLSWRTPLSYRNQSIMITASVMKDLINQPGL